VVEADLKLVNGGCFGWHNRNSPTSHKQWLEGVIHGFWNLNGTVKQ
jgi:hypothetical protein